MSYGSSSYGGSSYAGSSGIVAIPNISSNKLSYISVALNISTSLGAFINVSAGLYSGEYGDIQYGNNTYGGGTGFKQVSKFQAIQNAYIITGQAAIKLAYMYGVYIARTNKLAFIPVAGSFWSHSAYLVGTFWGIDRFINAYMFGHDAVSITFSSINSYIQVGPVPVTAFKSAYIESPGIIDTWQLNDNSSTLVDLYGIETGSTFNSPNFVDGPGC